jgi:hypothetical protein
VLLGTGVGAARATVIAVVSRLLFTIGDLGWGGGVALAVRKRTLPEPEQNQEQQSVG